MALEADYCGRLACNTVTKHNKNELEHIPKPQLLEIRHMLQTAGQGGASALLHGVVAVQ